MTLRSGAGILRDIISVERASTVSDGMGGTVDGWDVIIASLPARIMVQRGGETVQSARLQGSTPVDITVRATPVTATIQSGHRVRDASGAIYSVKWTGSLDEGRKRWITLSCVAGTVAQA